jgi:hypothetical protein
MPPSHFSMDPRKLSLQELLLYCLRSQDLAAWTAFVRHFAALTAVGSGIETPWTR